VCSVVSGDRLERGQQVALAQRLLEHPQRATDSIGVEATAMRAPEASRVLDILGPPGQNLGDDEVLGVDEWERDPAGASAASSSSAAGCIGAAEQLGESCVRAEILLACGGARPAIVQRKRLTPQLVRHTQALEGAETGDALAPVHVLRRAHGTPVAGHKRSTSPGDHISF
jgi:hypothetical protein